MERKVTVALSGMGGYGEHYVNAILNQSEEFGIECVGMISTHPERYVDSEAFKVRNIPIYRSIEELYDHSTPELLFVCTPIHLHFSQVCYALERGSNVLCEKPTSATLEEAEKILKKSKETGKFVAVGYQRCFHPAILKSKTDVLEGKYGKPISFKMIGIHQRPLSYFERAWAGKIKMGESCVYDSVASNACAHFLHHLFFMAGDRLNTSAFPKTIEAECYRANAIENYDTITLRIETENDVELYFATTLCSETKYGSICCFEFEFGKIIFDEHQMVKGFINGEEVVYGNMEEYNFHKIPMAVEAVRGKDTITCDAYTALPHSITIQYIQDNIKIKDIQNRAKVIDIANNGEQQVWAKCVEGLKEAMFACFEDKSMLSTKFNYDK